jgi:hypothetical protein
MSRETPEPAGPRWLLLFDSIHDVLAAERNLKRDALWHDLVPAPRDLTADCGMAVLFERADLERVRKALANPLVKVRSVHEPTEAGHREVTSEFHRREAP